MTTINTVQDIFAIGGTGFKSFEKKLKTLPQAEARRLANAAIPLMIEKGTKNAMASVARLEKFLEGPVDGKVAPAKAKTASKRKASKTAKAAPKAKAAPRVAVFSKRNASGQFERVATVPANGSADPALIAAIVSQVIAQMGA